MLALTMRARLLLLSGFLLLAAPAQSASAHASPVRYDPPASAVVRAAPDRIGIVFSERVEPAASEIAVYDPTGKRVPTGPIETDPRDARIFGASATLSASGTYAVSWQVISADDGHFTKGGYLFSVGHATGNVAGTPFQIQHRSSWPEGFAIFAELLGGALLLGALAVLGIWKRRESRAKAEAERMLERRLRATVAVAAVLVALGVAAYVWLESSGLAADRFLPMAGAAALFLKTAAGRWAVLRAALSLTAAAILARNLRPALRAQRRTVAEIAVVVLLCAVALARARVSHAAASDFLPALAILVNAVHLLAKDLWIGGLAAATLCLLPALDREGTATAARALLRLSRLLLWAFFVGGVTGCYIVWLHLKHPANLTTTHWGGMLLGLCAYALILLALRIYQHAVIEPALLRCARGEATGEARTDGETAGVLLLLETVVGFAVLLFSSVLVITTPPLSAHDEFVRTAKATGSAVSLGEHPYEEAAMLVTVSRNGGPASATGVLTLTVRNAAEGIGPLVVQTVERFPGGYVFPKSTFTPGGSWTVDVNEHEPETYDAVGHFSLSAPGDFGGPGATHPGPFAPFTLVLAATAVGIAALSLRLLRQNRLRSGAIGTDAPGHLPALAVRRPLFAFAIDVLIVLFVGLNAGHGHGGISAQRVCAEAGGTWHENVPMRDGAATGRYAALGCMLGSGRGTYHFTDLRELAYFTRPASALADMTTEPASPAAGEPATLVFRLRQPGFLPATELTAEHDRILHVIVAGEDGETFAHLHPEDDGPVTPEMLATATFPVRYAFPKPGRYLVGVDFTVRSQTFANSFVVEVGGGPVAGGRPVPSLVSETDGMRVTLTTPAMLRANERTTLRFDVAEGDGTLVTDLSPYLAAGMHLAIVKQDLSDFVHSHAQPAQTWWQSIVDPRDPSAAHAHVFLPERWGPSLTTNVVFPSPGRYDIHAEFNRGGKVSTARFTVDAQP